MDTFNDKLGTLIKGKSYIKREIENIFKCSLMGGMNKSNKTNTLVLVSKQVGNLYGDEWNDEGNILYYTGQGQVGDQSLKKQNETLANSNHSDIRVFLFEVFVEKHYVYQGEVFLCEKPYIEKELDKEDQLRNVYKFPIKLIDGVATPIHEDIIKKIEISKQKKYSKKTSEELMNIIKNKKTSQKKQYTTSTYIARDLVVNEITLRRAKGICDLCGKEAPFRKIDKTPYLESHHVIHLSKDGPDQIYNTVALCPNCHRKMHIVKSKKDERRLANVLYKYLLNEKEKEYIEQFDKLFGKIK